MSEYDDYNAYYEDRLAQEQYEHEQEMRLREEMTGEGDWCADWSVRKETACNGTIWMFGDCSLIMNDCDEMFGISPDEEEYLFPCDAWEWMEPSRVKRIFLGGKWHDHSLAGPPETSELSLER